MRYMGLLHTYKSYLPVNDRTPLLTLQEGNTPLVRAEKLSDDLDLDIYFKYEGLNPTGSFKDPNITIKSVSGGDPMVVDDSEQAVMEAIRGLEG